MKDFKTFIYAIMAGMCIGLGGAAYLSVENKVIGSALFTVALFTICTFGYNLYTGKVAHLFDNNRRYIIDVILIWLGNFVGCFVTAALFSMTRIAVISEKAASVCEVKLGDDLLSIFILGIFCNICIVIGVDGFKQNPHELGKYLSLFLGVMVFILCGFEHCIANMFYISMAGMWSGKAFVFLIVNTLGNAVGGWLIPVVKKALEKPE